MESLLDILYLQEYHKIRKGKQTFHLFKKGVMPYSTLSLSEDLDKSPLLYH